MNYSTDFQNLVQYCTPEKIFIGYGNPNAKILIVGKEHAFFNSKTPDNPLFYHYVYNQRNKDNNENISSWNKNILECIEPNWDNMPEKCVNPLYSHGAQPNTLNRNNNGGTSHTYLKYQKLYQFIFNEGQKMEHISFQKEFFITELSDIPTQKSFHDLKLNEIRKGAVKKRIDFFRQPFFDHFSVIIMAAGHYPKLYDFDMESIFNVEYKLDESFELGKGNWCNIHYDSGKKKILIHTRQLSTNVFDELLRKMAELIRPFI